MRIAVTIRWDSVWHLAWLTVAPKMVAMLAVGVQPLPRGKDHSFYTQEICDIKNKYIHHTFI